VYEYFSARACFHDKAVAFVFVVKFDDSLVHSPVD
jgi:hypothetical protein